MIYKLSSSQRSTQVMLPGHHRYQTIWSCRRRSRYPQREWFFLQLYTPKKWYYTYRIWKGRFLQTSSWLFIYDIQFDWRIYVTSLCYTSWFFHRIFFSSSFRQGQEIPRRKHYNIYLWWIQVIWYDNSRLWHTLPKRFRTWRTKPRMGWEACHYSKHLGYEDWAFEASSFGDISVYKTLSVRLVSTRVFYCNCLHFQIALTSELPPSVIHVFL